jgi:hypothetical protein
MADKEPNLRQRMMAAMNDITRVAKGGHNDKQGYDYTKADDIISEVRTALLAHGIVFLSSEVDQQRLPDRESRNGGAILGVVVKMQFTLMDTTSDEKLVGDHSGEGMDSGDKATNKAKTAALKYFLQQTFLIPTGDDPEKDDHDVKTVKDNARVNPYISQNGQPVPLETAAGSVKNTRIALIKKAKDKLGDEMGLKWLKEAARDLGKTSEKLTIDEMLALSERITKLAPLPAEDADIDD